MKRSGGLLIGLLLLVGLALPVMRATAQPTVVTADNLNEMIASAKTAADHEAIATYYDQEEAQNEKLLALHRASINIYHKSNNQMHCRGLIKAYKEAVEQDKALAALHREMGKKAGANAEH